MVNTLPLRSSGDLDGAWRVYDTICAADLGSDMLEGDYQWLLALTCAHDAYPRLKSLLLTIGSELSALSESTWHILKAYFTSDQGEDAVARGDAMAPGVDTPGRWRVTEVHVDPQVRITGSSRPRAGSGSVSGIVCKVLTSVQGYRSGRAKKKRVSRLRHRSLCYSI